jgi:hypothetical protein
VTRTYLIPRFGSTPLGKLTRADFKEWFAGLAAERKPDGKPRYSPGTLRKVQVVLSSILNEGIVAKASGLRDPIGVGDNSNTSGRASDGGRQEDAALLKPSPRRRCEHKKSVSVQWVWGT